MVWSFYRFVQRFQGGLVLKARRLCVSLSSRLESNKERRELIVTREPFKDVHRFKKVLRHLCRFTNSQKEESFLPEMCSGS